MSHAPINPTYRVGCGKCGARKFKTSSTTVRGLAQRGIKLTCMACGREIEANTMQEAVAAMRLPPNQEEPKK